MSSAPDSTAEEMALHDNRFTKGRPKHRKPMKYDLLTILAIGSSHGSRASPDALDRWSNGYT
jgi:hypothetical protein